MVSRQFEANEVALANRNKAINEENRNADFLENETEDKKIAAGFLKRRPNLRKERPTSTRR